MFKIYRNSNNSISIQSFIWYNQLRVNWMKVMEIATGLKVKLQRHLWNLPVNLKEEKRREDLP